MLLLYTPCMNHSSKIKQNCLKLKDFWELGVWVVIAAKCHIQSPIVRRIILTILKKNNNWWKLQIFISIQTLFLAFPQCCIVRYAKLQKGAIFSGLKKNSSFHQSSYFLKIFKITCRLMELYTRHFLVNSPPPPLVPKNRA